MNNVMGFKLMNGYEVIAELDSETSDYYSIRKAVFWDLVQMEGGKYDIQFSPLSAGIKLAEDATNPSVDINLPKISVLFTYEPRTEIESRYKRLVSPIILVNGLPM